MRLVLYTLEHVSFKQLVIGEATATACKCHSHLREAFCQFIHKREALSLARIARMAPFLDPLWQSNHLPCFASENVQVGSNSTEKSN